MASELISDKLDRLTNALAWLKTNIEAAGLYTSQMPGDETNNVNYPLVVFWPEEFEGENVTELFTPIIRFNLVMNGTAWATISVELKKITDVLENTSLGQTVPNSEIYQIIPVMDDNASEGVGSNKVAARISLRIFM